MAAREQARPMRLMELRSLNSAALERVLEEECARWRAMLHWDFTPSAELVSRYVGMQALDGFALLDGDETVGYTYWVAEEHKGLVGDLYVRDAWRSPVNENLLLGAALEQLRRSPWIQRVEAQLLQLGLRGQQVAAAGMRPRIYPRHFMLAQAKQPAGRRPVQLDPELRLEYWGSRWLDQSCELIAEVYRGHVDSEINDQYHTPAGARRFLQNIVHYPGCGHFSPASSLVALDAAGRARGLVLSTMVSQQCGHIAQICISPELQGRGIGYELLRRGMESLRAEGAQEVSLTVTAANRHAIRLYERFGYQVVYQFEALVWERLWQ
ncbi:MAG: N-acetyltransferase [Acidobacteria bacterium]|nr:N-acetyltransferase [Acidobacteriota bacterium]